MNAVRRAGRRVFGAWLLIGAASLASPTAAVPIPWKNCGKAGDVLTVQKYDASNWPPSVAAPFNATATLDTSGQITNLSVFLLFGPEWTLETGPLPASASGGFVSLPASMPVTVKNPPPPIKAGPFAITRTFTFDGLSTTINSSATMTKDIDPPPITTTLSLSFNGTPGFPLKPQIGVYSLHVQMTTDGQGVFCLDLSMPLKTAVPVVRIERPSSIPLLSPLGLAVLALLLALCGMVAAQRAIS